jgi:cytochrome b6-f complex iron-sulfur subunit
MLAEPVVAQVSTEPEPAQPIAEEVQPVETEVATPVVEVAAPALAPQSPGRKRTPEEVRAQREAFMAAKAARAAGQAVAAAPAPPPPPAAAPAAAKAAPAPVAAPARAAAPRPQAAAPAPAAATAQAIDPKITRRELLNYAWLASIGLFALETVGLSLWFAFPNFKAGQFGGVFPIGSAVEILPEVNSAPVPYTDGKFWLINVDTQTAKGEPRKGVLAIYKVCTHLGCLYEWVPVTTRFECPCHGSKFALTGDYIAGPARRNLDRFVIRAVAPDGSVKETDADGNPLVINGDETLEIDTGRRILGSSNITPA